MPELLKQKCGIVHKVKENLHSLEWNILVKCPEWPSILQVHSRRDHKTMQKQAMNAQPDSKYDFFFQEALSQEF